MATNALTKIRKCSYHLPLVHLLWCHSLGGQREPCNDWDIQLSVLKQWGSNVSIVNEQLCWPTSFLFMFDGTFVSASTWYWMYARRTRPKPDPWVDGKRQGPWGCMCGITLYPGPGSKRVAQEPKEWSWKFPTILHFPKAPGPVRGWVQWVHPKLCNWARDQKEGQRAGGELEIA